MFLLSDLELIYSATFEYYLYDRDIPSATTRRKVWRRRHLDLFLYAPLFV